MRTFQLLDTRGLRIVRIMVCAPNAIVYHLYYHRNYYASDVVELLACRIDLETFLEISKPFVQCVFELHLYD